MLSHVVSTPLDWVWVASGVHPAGANASGAVTFAGLVEGDHVNLVAATAPTSFAQASVGNLGLFRVVRVAAGEVFGAGGTVWIENPDAVAETAEVAIRGLAYDSLLPGDRVSVSHAGWGADNAGEWVVSAVGTGAGTTTPQFVTTGRFRVSVAERQPVPVTSPAAALGTNAALTTVREGAASRMTKRVVALSPNADPGFADVRLDTAAGSRLLSAANETVLFAADRLGFPTGEVPGHDAYQQGAGLVGEVNRIVYGDPTDEETYPGVVAEGASVIVSGPTVRRIAVSLLVSALTRFARADVAARVRSAVAAVVNRAGVGESIPLSAIVTAAGRVQGVSAVTVLSPRYDATNAVIAVSATEKPRVLDLEADVSVSFA